MNKPGFKGGINIAIKIPVVHFEKTIAFYKDILGLPLKEEQGQLTGPSYSCAFGPNRLWFDRVENYSQSDVWLELETPDLEEAVQYLQEKDVPIRDELEPLPAGLKGHWISSPAGTVHLLVEE
jgi:catechol 2,3-dioxygenase-like lactoylglutathione lyase family enzyme